jgi:hypothetical protein
MKKESFFIPKNPYCQELIKSVLVAKLTPTLSPASNQAARAADEVQ